MNVLVTGASGYVGGRLIPSLLDLGHQVTVLARDPRRVQHREWSDRVRIVAGDLMDLRTLEPALEDMDAAYYLVHSMHGGKDFATRDRQAAQNFVQAGSHLSQVIYLGGLVPEPGGRRSAHLESRAEVGRILRRHLPTTELRAGPIIGSGSASFEMVRYLTERLPAMVAPRWILNPVQPIAIRDVLSYLVSVLGRVDCHGILEVGTDPLTFRQMMMEYARARRLPRWILPVPVLAPRLAARWVGLVTPIPNTLAVPLVEGVVRPLLADTSRVRSLMPDIQPLSYRAAVDLAIQDTERGNVGTRWSGALGDAPAHEFEEDREGVIREVRTRHLPVQPARVYDVFSGLGGERGWLVWNWAWRIRGMLDRLVGGPGLRRGRRHPSQVLTGEAIDFWRVEEARPPRTLRLRAEMKVPGRAWLQWEAIPEDGGTRLVQTAFFAPTGLLGFLYWYGIHPVHARIFSDLVDAVAREAMAHSREPHDTRPGREPEHGTSGLEGSFGTHG